MQTIYGSHAAIPNFRLVRPRSAAEAAAAKADLGADAHYFGGGVDLVPALRAGRAISALIVVGGIEGFAAVARAGDTLAIGAGLTYAGLAVNETVRAAVPAFADAIAGVANIRVRHAATLGGNVMARNPAYDLLPSLLVLGAKLVFTTPRGEAQTDGSSTESPAGLLARIEIPLAERRFVLERGHKPVISLALAVERRGGKLLGRAAVGCAHAWPVGRALDLAGAADFAALGDCAAAIAADFAAKLPQPATDYLASGAYRRHLAEVLLRRALIRVAAG
jgi:carbon-monoxide dehydrogenase medium subunit